MKSNRTLVATLLWMSLLGCREVQAQACSDPRLKATIFFVNGINTPTDEDADWNLRELKRRLEAHILSNGVSLSLGCLSFDYAYNSSLGIPLDIFEAAQQLGVEPSMFWRIWTGLAPTPNWFQSIIQGHIISSFVSYVTQRDLQEHLRKYRATISVGDKIVAVSHSQGNLFANDAHKELYFGPSPVASHSFNIVAVATPASFVSGQSPPYTYTTVEGDIIASPPMRLAFGTLPSNTPVGDCGGPIDCHRFVETYLERDVSRERILNDILAAVLGRVPPGSWSMFQHDAQHTGMTSASGPNWNSDVDVRMKWIAQVPNPSLQSPLVAGDGTVLVGSLNTTTGSGVLLALNSQNGAEMWRADHFASAPSSAAIGPDGTIYACAGSPVGRFGAIYALTANGVPKWRFDISQGACNSPIVSRSGIIYVTTPPPLNQQTAALIAIKPDGTEKWRYEESNNGTTMAALSNDESQVYAAFHGRLLAFDAQTGGKLWEQSPPNSFANLILGGFAPTVDASDRIFLVSFEPNRDCGLYANSLLAYAKDGALLWSTPTISCAFGIRAIGSTHTGEVIVTALGSLLRFDSQTGQQVGNPIALPGVASTAIVIDGQGRVYVGTSSWPNFPSSMNGIAAVEGDRVVWFFPTSAPPAQFSPAMGPDGAMYFMAGITFHALGP